MRENFWGQELAPFVSLMEVKAALKKADVDQNLLLVIYLLVSQINGCGYCIKLHTQECLDAGVPQAKVDALANWDNTDVFSDQEKAAFAWSEAMTRLENGGPSDSTYNAVKAHYSGDELVNLSFAVVTMNALNRLAISFPIEA